MNKSMEKIAAELQDSVVDLTRQLTELQAQYESVVNHHRTQMQALDERELQLQVREEEVKEKQLQREEHLGLLEKSVEDRERYLDELHESLEQQRKHSKALQNVLEEKLREFEENAREVGVEVSGDVRGLELKRGGLVGCEMRGVVDVDKVVKLIGAVSKSRKIVELCRGLDSTDKIHDVIRVLIERKQLIEAVRFICTFKLKHKFSPVPLLNEYVGDAEKWWSEIFSQKESLEDKENAVDDRLTSLRAVVQCVEDYNLHSEYSLADIIDDILELKNVKENLHSVASLDTMMKTQGYGEVKEKREVVLCLPSYDGEQRVWRKRSFSNSASPYGH